ncbi:MAG: DUF1289 domain-containing protein [Planctomycetes bacterium]|nr:DUF1289 domain-containing protein [Planctomycetota bacterium]
MSGSESPKPPQSPCIRVCVLDDARRHCTGCARTVDEIARWWTMRDDEKRAVLAQLPQRRRGL